jgi:hypothetical protein
VAANGDLYVMIRDMVYQSSPCTVARYRQSVPMLPLSAPVTGGAAVATLASLDIFPNPSSNRTTIEYSLGAAGDVSIELFDELGRRVALLAAERRHAGTHQIEFSPDDYDLSAGIYLVTLTIKGESRTRQLIVVR